MSTQQELATLKAKIQNNIKVFLEDFEQEGNKSAARRARRASLLLSKQFKEYRSLSIQAEKE